MVCPIITHRYFIYGEKYEKRIWRIRWRENIFFKR